MEVAASMNQSAPQPELNERRPDRIARSNRTVFTMLAIVGIGMFGFAFANVPLFFRLCRKYGILPPELKGPQTIANKPDQGRALQIYWLANHGDLPIAFSVHDSVQDIHVGERSQNDYRFVNLSDKTIYFRPVHDVSPSSAGQQDTLTLEKCFCFDNQMIEPGKEYTLPVIYSFNSKLPTDVSSITMSYTLFATTKEMYEETLKKTQGAQTGEVAATQKP